MHPIRRPPAMAALAAALVLGCLAGCQQQDLPASNPCDPNRSPCSFTLANGDAGRIEFSPRPLPLMKPIAVRVEAPTAVRSARLDFQGTSMDMGFNQVTLRDDGHGVLAGTALLPVCATGAMRWRVDLYLGDSTTAAARFEFNTASPGP